MPLIYSEEAGAFIESETPKICVGGAWQDSKGLAYQGDAWVDVWPIKLWLYNNGSGVEWVGAKMYRGATFENISSYLRLYNPNSNIQGTCMSQARIKTAVDVSAYHKLVLSGNSNLSGNGFFSIMVLPNTGIDNSPYWENVVSGIESTQSNNIRISLDISKTNGDMYIGIALSSDNIANKYANIYEIWLE